MRRIIAKDPANTQRIAPYIGGEELNSSPTQSPHRFVINFGTMSEAEAKRWPDLLAILAAKVKPERASKAKDVAAWPWWHFWRPRAELYHHASKLPRILANSQVSAHHALAFQPTDRVFSHALNLFLLDTYAAFALLQSRVHEVWARFFASSMKDDLRYTPSTCFETFPFPPGWQSAATNGELERAGREYYEYRAGLMVRRGEGLTKTYNRFHDPDERDPEIERLRELHAAMDAAVLRAYGWHDLAAAATCEFLLDYEDDPQNPTEAAPTPSKKPRKKPYRLRWPDPLHDQTLARLLQQNQSQSQPPPQPPTTPTPKPKKTKTPTKKTPKNQPSLLPDDDPNDS
jgi:hypothetical protein